MAEDLDLAGGIVQVDEHAAVADGADAAGDRDPILGLGAGRQPGIAPLELPRLGGARKAVGVGIDAELPQPRQLGQPRRAKLVFFAVFFRHVRSTTARAACFSLLPSNRNRQPRRRALWAGSPLTLLLPQGERGHVIDLPLPLRERAGPMRSMGG